MGLVSWLVVGGIAGWLAGQIGRGRGFGLVGNIVVGILGGLVAGWLGGTLFGAPDLVNGFNLGSILAAFVGALLLIWVIGLLRK
jgi:uncharacterized membrane protein YeaQ/YmgE (transglycosylase-associated protein family)